MRIGLSALFVLLSLTSVCHAVNLDSLRTQRVIDVMADTSYEYVLTGINHWNEHWHGSEIPVPTHNQFIKDYLRIDSIAHDDLSSTRLYFGKILSHLVSFRYSTIVAVDTLTNSATLITTEMYNFNNDSLLRSVFPPAFKYYCGRLKQLDRSATEVLIDSALETVFELLNVGVVTSLRLIHNYKDIPVDSVKLNTEHNPSRHELRFLSEISPARHIELGDATETIFYAWTGNGSVWRLQIIVSDSFFVSRILIERMGKYGAGPANY